jgi:secreted trypsin-like serine protease
VSSPSSYLRNAKISIYPFEKCKDVEYGTPKNEVSQICAGDITGFKDSCQGDSGGGLYNLDAFNGSAKRFTVSGVVSYGEGCGRIGKPGKILKEKVSFVCLKEVFFK